MLSAQKLSITVNPLAFAFLDAYRQQHRVASRSQVINEALSALQQREQERALELAYSQSAAEDKAINTEFESAHADGLSHEAW